MRRRGRRPYDDILTPREWQVLQLIADGLTNEEIAVRLGISFGGAKYHVAEILSKFGVSSREEAVTLARQARHGREQRGLLGWLPWRRARDGQGASYGVAAALGATVLVLLASLAFALTSWPFGTTTSLEPPVNASGAGPDVAPDGRGSEATHDAPPYSRTILISKGDPQHLRGEEPTFAALRRVETVRELKAALTPEINLIVIDKSVAAEVVASGLIARELDQGRYILGLNVCFEWDAYLNADAFASTGGISWETSPSGVTTYYTAEGRPRPQPLCSFPVPMDGVNEPFFSYNLQPGFEKIEAARTAGRGPRTGLLNTEVMREIMGRGEAPRVMMGPGVVRLLEGKALRFALAQMDSGDFTDVAVPSCERARELGLADLFCETPTP